MTDVPDGAADTVAGDTGAKDFDEATERIPELIGTLGEHADTAVRQQVDELLQCVDRVHREALTRLAGLLQHHNLLDHACGDPLVGTLFDLYDLAPEEEEEAPPPPPPPSKTRVVTSFGAGPVAPKGSTVIGLTDLKRFPVQGPAAVPAAATAPASPLAPTATPVEPAASTPEPAAAIPEPAAAPPPESPAPPAPDQPAPPPQAAVQPSPPAPPAPGSVPAFRPGQYPVASFPEGSARASSSWEPPSPGGSAAAVGKAALEMGMTGLPGFGIPRPRPKGADDAAPDGAAVEPDPSLALPPTGGASFDLRDPRPAGDPESPFGFDLLGGGMESLKSRPVRPGTLPPAAAAAGPAPIAAPAAAQAAGAPERVPAGLGPTEAAPSPAPAVPVAAGGSRAKPTNEPEWTELFSPEYVPADTVAASSDQRVLVINSAGTLHAVLNRCGGGPLPLTFAKVSGNRLLCPWHRDCDYDIAKGEAANGRRLVNYPLRVQDGIIQVDVANGWATGPLTPEQRVSPIR